MIRRATLIGAAGLAAAAMAVFQLKYEVRLLEEERSTLARALEAEHDAIRVLTAEWAFLNHPDKLTGLAERHLDLDRIAPHQIIDLDALPYRQARFVPGATVAAEAHDGQ